MCFVPLRGSVIRSLLDRRALLDHFGGGGLDVLFCCRLFFGGGADFMDPEESTRDASHPDVVRGK